jgi:hypothetical protein
MKGREYIEGGWPILSRILRKGGISRLRRVCDSEVDSTYIAPPQRPERNYEMRLTTQRRMELLHPIHALPLRNQPPPKRLGGVDV